MQSLHCVCDVDHNQKGKLTICIKENDEKSNIFLHIDQLKVVALSIPPGRASGV